MATRPDVLLVEDEKTTRTVMRRMLERDGYPVIEATTGAEGLKLATPADAPRILIIDWVLPELGGLELCRLLRAMDHARSRYILLVTAKTQRRDMLAALGAGADDFMAKPVAPDLLRARLRVAERITAGAAASDAVRRALFEAQSTPGGELIVRTGDIVGRIFFHGGKVAWAHVSNEPATLLSVVENEVELAPTDAEAVIAECRRSGRNFGDVLVSWGLVDRSKLNDSVRRWIARKLAAILRFESAAVLFVPQERKFSGDLMFTLDELLSEEELGKLAAMPPRRAPSLRPGPGSSSGESAEWDRAFLVTSRTDTLGVQFLLEEAMAIDGATGAALLDRERAVCLGRAGATISADIVWAHLSALNAHGAGEAVQDIVVRTDKSSHVLCTVPTRPSLFLYLRLSLTETAAAMARVQLHSIAKRLAEGLDRVPARPSDAASSR